MTLHASFRCTHRASTIPLRRFNRSTGDVDENISSFCWSEFNGNTAASQNDNLSGSEVGGISPAWETNSSIIVLPLFDTKPPVLICAKHSVVSFDMSSHKAVISGVPICATSSRMRVHCATRYPSCSQSRLIVHRLRPTEQAARKEGGSVGVRTQNNQSKQNKAR